MSGGASGGDAPLEDGWPSVSAVLAVRDEETTLAAAVESVLAQDYPGALEVVVAVAPSADRTAVVAHGLAAGDPRIVVVANPRAGTAAGLNAAIAASSGEIVARVDGHSTLLPGYLRRAVELLTETGADNVGGIQQAVGTTAVERAVAAAMTSRFGVGDAKFHYGGAAGPTDTVYLGVFRRDALRRVSGFDETLDRNQDYELNWRLRRSGGVVYFSPDLRVTYRPRGTLRGLARQYWEYGRWKREVLLRHPGSLRWRQLVAPATLVANTLAGAAALLGRRWLLIVPGAYLAAVVGAAVSVPAPTAAAPAGTALRPLDRALVAAAFVTMHLSWGAGFLRGGASSRALPPAPARRPALGAA